MRRKWNIELTSFKRIARHGRRIFAKKKYRDELFRRIFNNRKSLLELYNAINETDYTDESELIIYTMEDVIYLGYKNDVSFIVSGMLNLYEHQSTINPNMPLRGLIYLGKQYESYILQHKLNVYGSSLVKVPFPQYIIFYNGTKPLENSSDKMTLRLSDSFMKPDRKDAVACLECMATVYNINYGHNQNMMKRCRTLEEYSIFISRVMENIEKNDAFEVAVDTAVVSCIEDGILEDFLLKHRAEVVGMLFEEFDMKEYLKMERRDSYAEGKAEGKAESLLDVLEDKGEIPEALKQKIQAEKDTAVLRQWLKLATKVSTVSEFEEKL